jgi:hypothetical protein
VVTLYDDLRDHPVEFMRAIYTVLGVDTSFDAGLGGIRVNAADGKKLLAKSGVVWSASTLLAHVGMRSAAEWLRRENSVTMPPMSPQTHARLVDVYKEQDRLLQELIGRDISQWDSPWSPARRPSE